MNPVTRTKKPLWLRVLRFLIFAVVALFLLALVVRLTWGFVSARQMRHELAQIQAAGEPLTFDELDAASSPVSEAGDAAPHYVAALALLEQVSDFSEVMMTYHDAAKDWPIQQPDVPARDQLRQILVEAQPVLELLDKAAATETCRYDLGAGHGIQTVIERLGPPRSAARLLGLRSLDLAFGKHPEAAVDSVISILKMQRITERHPVLIAHLVRISIDALACQTAVIVLELSDPSDASLAGLQQSLLSANEPDRLTRCLVAERVFGILLHRNIITGSAGMPSTTEDGSSPAPQLFSGFWGRPVFESMAVGYLRDMATAIHASRNPPPQVYDHVSGMTAESRQGAIIIPALRQAVLTDGQGLAIARCTRGAVMIERFRLAHGELPQSLSDLIPTFADALPSDPFTGQALQYRVDENSYVVYSVGDDRHDDGGQIEEQGQLKRSDWGVRVRSMGKGAPQETTRGSAANSQPG